MGTATARYTNTHLMKGMVRHQIWITVFTAIVTAIIYILTEDTRRAFKGAMISVGMVIVVTHLLVHSVHIRRIELPALVVAMVNLGTFTYYFTEISLLIIFWIMMILIVPVRVWFSNDLKPCNRRTASKLLLQGLLLSGFFWLLFS